MPNAFKPVKGIDGISIRDAGLYADARGAGLNGRATATVGGVELTAQLNYTNNKQLALSLSAERVKVGQVLRSLLPGEITSWVSLPLMELINGITWVHHMIDGSATSAGLQCALHNTLYPPVSTHLCCACACAV